MISYKYALFGWHGSVVPKAALIGAISGLIGAGLKHMEKNDIAPFAGFHDWFVIKTAAFSGIMSVLGFLVIFRTSHAYGRFREGSDLLSNMRASLWGTASATIAYSNLSKKPREEIDEFQHMVVRLFSLFSAMCLAKLEGQEVTDQRIKSLQILDCTGIDSSTLDALVNEPASLELVYHYIESLLAQGVKKEYISMPPPIISRIFQQLEKSFATYNSCREVAVIPFPFPYAQATTILLLMHWILTPLVVASWTEARGMAFTFTFVWVFMLWCLRAISMELENPFGDFVNDLPIKEYQMKMNTKLRLLLKPSVRKVPKFNSNYDYVSHLSAESILRSIVHASCLTELEGSTPDQDTDDDDDDDEDLSSVTSDGLRYIQMNPCKE